MKPLPALFIISVMLLSSLSVAVADSSFNNTTITQPHLPHLSVSDYVNRILIAFKAWRFDSKDLIKTNTGIYVDDQFWNWVTGSIQASANLTDMALDWLNAFKEKVQNDEPVQWIIITWVKPNDRLKEALEAVGAKVLYVDDGINAISISARPSLIKNLVYNQAFDFPFRFYIREVWPDFYVANGPTSVESVNAAFLQGNITPGAVANANWNIKLIKADLAWSKDGITGKGVTIAVVDTGVDCNHVMLRGACIAKANFVTDEPDEDLNGHGTHVASTAAGRPVKANVDGKIVYVSGVAPEANILAVKVLNKAGSGTMTQILQGLDYVVQWHHRHPNEPIVVSMSLGSPFGSPRDPMVQKVEQLIREEHIPVVIAAGNEFVVIDTPGIATDAITVAAVDRNMKVASFSGKGPGLSGEIKPDIAAPGVRIVAAKAGSGNGFIAMSGTSMATPHVSGVVALILQKYGTLTPESVKLVLEKTAYPLNNINALPTWSGAGLVDAYAAVNAEPPKESFWGWLRRFLP